MKVLILVAGLGIRPASLTNYPKELVFVNRKPILIKQVENFHANGFTDITIVSRYKADVLERTVHEMYPEIMIKESKGYAVTNNRYSAYLGTQLMFPDGTFFQPFFDDDIL